MTTGSHGVITWIFSLFVNEIKTYQTLRQGGWLQLIPNANMPRYQVMSLRKSRRPLRSIFRLVFFLLFSIFVVTLALRVVYSSKSSMVGSEYRKEPFFKSKHKYDCARLIRGEFEQGEVSTSPEHRVQLRRPLNGELPSWKRFGNCTEVFGAHFYPQQPGSQEELDFPLAYTLLINEHLEQVELLFNAIYAPQNVYCIHVDFKVSHLFHDAIDRLASCFSNVFAAKKRIAISHGDSSMLYAQKSCLRHLLEDPQWSSIPWKYVLLLQGHDFPLRTNAELVNILKIHKGANDVELLETPLERILEKYAPIYDSLGFVADLRPTAEKKIVAPHNLTIYKGSVATVLNRDMAKFSLYSRVASDLLEWLNDTLMPDELYWSTLNHNEFLKIPGGYPGRCVQAKDGLKSWISRFAVWQQYTHLTCNGTWRHSVCLFSTGDLPMLSKRREIFLNKFWLPYDSVVLDCMHELLFNRTYRIIPDDEYSLDTNFYKVLSSVQYQNWRLRHPDEDSTHFQCVTCNGCTH